MADLDWSLTGISRTIPTLGKGGYHVMKTSAIGADLVTIRESTNLTVPLPILETHADRSSGLAKVLQHRSAPMGYMAPARLNNQANKRGIMADIISNDVQCCSLFVCLLTLESGNESMNSLLWKSFPLRL